MFGRIVRRGASRLRSIHHALQSRWAQLSSFYEANLTIPRNLRRTIERIAARQTPVLVGPWLSEVGFELLYWVPMLRHLFRTHGIHRDRVLVLSRGGAWPWYQEIAADYFEILDHVSTAQFLEANSGREMAQNGRKKHFSLGAFDQQLIRLATAQKSWEEWDLVHPALMYGYIRGCLRGWLALKRMRQLLDHSPVAVVLERPADLPIRGPYVAVKFYFSSCFPDTPQNRHFVDGLLRGLTRQYPVVLLNTGLQLDDHSDAMGEDLPSVYDATALMQPRNNLEVQTALVANAEFLVCTYGGFSYLAPLLGKQSISFYSHPNFVGHHLQLAMEVLNPDDASQFAALPTGALNRLLGDARMAA